MYIFENAAIDRLDSIIARLNSLLEKKLITAFKSKKIGHIKNDDLIDHLLSVEEVLSQLARARDAENLFYRAHRVATEQRSYTISTDSYLRAATIVYQVLSELSANDTNQALCGVTVSSELLSALKKASKIPALKEHADNLYSFIINDAPAHCWSSVQEDHKGMKIFELAKTQADFKQILKNGFKDITSGDLGGIRIAYNNEVACIYTHSQKENINAQLQKTIKSQFFENLYHPGIDLLYPDSEFRSTYYIYIPSDK